MSKIPITNGFCYVLKEIWQLQLVRFHLCSVCISWVFFLFLYEIWDFLFVFSHCNLTKFRKKKIVKILFTSPSLFTDHWTEIWKLKSKLREREYRLSKLYSLAELIEQSAAERQNQNNGNNVLNNKFNATFLYV